MHVTLVVTPISFTTEIYNEEEEYPYNLEEEIEYYNILINKGGRPLYLVSLS